MKTPKKQIKYEFQIPNIHYSQNNKVIIPPNRYKGVGKMYQMNISKMLMKYPDNKSPMYSRHNIEHYVQDTDQLMVVNSMGYQQRLQKKLKMDKTFRNLDPFIKTRVALTQKKSFTRKFEDFATNFVNRRQQSVGFELKISDQNDKFQLYKNQIDLIKRPSNSQLFVTEKKIIDPQLDYTSKVKKFNPTKNNFQNQTKRNNFNSKKDKLAQNKKALQLPELNSTKNIHKNQQYMKTAPVSTKNKNTSSPNKKQAIPKNAIALPLQLRDLEQLKIVKSESYAVMEYPTKNLILSNKGINSLQIASLTKIMTFYTIRRLTNLLGINVAEENVTITDKATEMTGTSAQIVSGQIYTIEQLFYGLMLPSGNDAAMALAQWGGETLLTSAYDISSKLPTLSLSHIITQLQQPISPISQQQTTANIPSKLKLKAFLNLMNHYCKQLNLTATKFANPHGLPNQQSKSTAIDVAKLCVACLDDQLFIKVTSTQKYQCSVLCPPPQQNKNGTKKQKKKLNLCINSTNIIKKTPQREKRIVQWENTNKLIRREGFVGIKTGITVTAGPCLATAFKFRDKIYVTVILRASKASRRFKQTRKILYACLLRIYKNSLTPIQKKALDSLKKNRPEFDSDYSQDEHEFNYEICDTAEIKKRSNFINYQM